jgi:hypothetical protein
MRLAGSEIHQVDALGAQFGSLGGDGHGCGNFDAGDAIGKNLRSSSDCHDASIFTDFEQLWNHAP